MTVAGVTSTGSKRPDVLFDDAASMPQRMARSRGCRIWTQDGREYVDFIMGLGAVALGYGDPAVDSAVIAAVERGAVGSLSPEDEPALASELHAVMPWLAKVRFLKSGAEAVAAAVRIARAATAREQVLGCGYHGWLDWCSDSAGVPASTRALFGTIPFNDAQASRDIIRRNADRLACVVIEPVIDAAPSVEWLQVIRAETERCGAVLVFDEIKTAFRVALGGAAERWGVVPDLMVMGKALANGYPLAAVGGRGELMETVNRTWISSTLATEFVSLAAARATVSAMVSRQVPSLLAQRGDRLLSGLRDIASRHGARGVTASGIETMCYLRYDDDALSRRVAVACATRGLLFKRNAYNFVSLAHDDAVIDAALQTLDEVLTEC